MLKISKISCILPYEYNRTREPCIELKEVSYRSFPKQTLELTEFGSSSETNLICKETTIKSIKA